VMRLADRGVRAIMTPRVDIEWVDLASGDDVILEAIRHTRYARLVACDGDPDNVVGFVRVREILQQRLDGRQTPIRAMVQTPVLLPDTLGALEALDRLHSVGDGFGLVVDEYGHYEGVVTPDDALRAIRGQAVEASDEGDESVVRRADGSYLLSGALPIDNLDDLLGIPLPEDRDYHTIAGLVLYEMRRLPKVGDAVTYAGWRFEVVDMDGRRIDRILAIGPTAAKS
jgi:putative hemolysin